MDSPHEDRARLAERSDVQLARVGDEAAFERLVARHRPVLLAHCYSMVGSLPDAEDAVQEALVRAWRHLDSFRGDAGLGSWLHRVATNVCLTALDRGRRRDVPVGLDQADAESDGVRWLGPFPTASWPVERVELRESVELAFAAALQHLPPRQRAVLLLRDVLRLRGVVVGNATVLMAGIAVDALLLLTTRYAQQVLGAGALGFGVLACAMTVTSVAGVALGQRIVGRVAVRPVAATGMVLIASAGLLLTASGLEETSFGIGGTLGTAAGSAVVAALLAAHAGVPQGPGLAGVLSGGYVLVAVVGVVGALLALALPRTAEPVA